MSFNRSSLTALVVTLTAQPALAIENTNFRFETTADLFEICRVAPDTPEYALANQACRAFIEGAVQYHDQVSSSGTLEPVICYPEGATIQDGKDAFVAWAERNRSDAELMKEQPVLGLVRALAAKYPCKP